MIPTMAATTMKINFLLLNLFILSRHFQRTVAARHSITLGYIAPIPGATGFQQTASAATMALEKAKAEGYLNDTDIK